MAGAGHYLLLRMFVTTQPGKFTLNLLGYERIIIEKVNQCIELINSFNQVGRNLFALYIFTLNLFALEKRD
jgi:hypothetical protein